MKKKEKKWKNLIKIQDIALNAENLYFFRQIMFEGSIHYHSECKGCHYRPKSLPGKTIQESLELLDNWLNK